MKLHPAYAFVALLAFLVFQTQAATLYVDLNSTNATPPFSDWSTAATNIQDAIDASSVGDLVLVTNGVYATGGKSMDGVITNRISVTKAILVQSVNGPAVTTIQGALDPVTTNGPAAVRCAWLASNATLSGFTLYGGATAIFNTSQSRASQGGGVYSATINAYVSNCVIATNYSSFVGGGAAGATFNHCTFIGNHSLNQSTHGGGGAVSSVLNNCRLLYNVADLSWAGGADSCMATNCFFMGNRGAMEAGAVYGGTLVHCTVVNNITLIGSAAVANATVSNCIIYRNTGYLGGGIENYSGIANHSDILPLPSGTGNISVDPQLLSDNIHLAATSPCIGVGIASAGSLTDIDGQPWNNPPSMGCDEWLPQPVLLGPPAPRVNLSGGGFAMTILAAGQSPFTCFWSKDGVAVSDDGHYANSATANLLVNNANPADAGYYQVTVSNAFGAATSQVAQVTIHFVDANSTNAVAPYVNWSTAATNIQDAIDAANTGEIVIVTNGLYAIGGRVVSGGPTNRIAVNKAVLVTSVNGYAATAIQGAINPVTTNGPAAVRCAYLADGAALNGFTLRRGATLSSGDSVGGGPLESGGGVYCASTNVIVSNCVLTNNTAVFGGGISAGTLNNSLVIANVAMYGAGAYKANVNNCTLVNNMSPAMFPLHGAGTYNGVVRNSIVIDNFDAVYDQDNWSTMTGMEYAYSFSYPKPPGMANIEGDSQFLDFYHISTNSPCRGTGITFYSTGTDMDGEAWGNPPSMGWDEVVISNLVGPLAVSFKADHTNVFASHLDFFNGTIEGRAGSVSWSFGDGSTFSGQGIIANHEWTNAGDYTVTFTAYNNDNPSGVATNLVMHVAYPTPPQLEPGATLTNGVFQFQFNGQATLNYAVQYTTNLTVPVVWQTLRYIYPAQDGPTQVTDSVPNGAARFYRVMMQ